MTARAGPSTSQDTGQGLGRTVSSTAQVGHLGYFARAGCFTSTLVSLNAGITSLAKRSSCSSANASGTPTDRLTEMRSSAGIGFFECLQMPDDFVGRTGQEAAGVHRVLDPRQFRGRCAGGIAHDLDLLLGHARDRAAAPRTSSCSLRSIWRHHGCTVPCCRQYRNGSRSTAAHRVRYACRSRRAPAAISEQHCASRRPRPNRRRPCPGCRALP